MLLVTPSESGASAAGIDPVRQGARSNDSGEAWRSLWPNWRAGISFPARPSFV